MSSVTYISATVYFIEQKKNLIAIVIYLTKYDLIVDVRHKTRANGRRHNVIGWDNSNPSLIKIILHLK